MNVTLGLFHIFSAKGYYISDYVFMKIKDFLLKPRVRLLMDWKVTLLFKFSVPQDLLYVIIFCLIKSYYYAVWPFTVFVVHEYY